MKINQRHLEDNYHNWSILNWHHSSRPLFETSTNPILCRHVQMLLTCQSKVRKNSLSNGREREKEIDAVPSGSIGRGPSKYPLQRRFACSICRWSPRGRLTLYRRTKEDGVRGPVTNADRVRGRGDKMRSCLGAGWQGSGCKIEEKRNWYIVREEWANRPPSAHRFRCEYLAGRSGGGEGTLSLLRGAIKSPDCPSIDLQR